MSQDLIKLIKSNSKQTVQWFGGSLVFCSRTFKFCVLILEIILLFFERQREAKVNYFIISVAYAERIVSKAP